MPKVQVTNQRGLVQSAGEGFQADSGLTVYHVNSKAGGSGPSALVVGKGNTRAAANPFAESSTQLWPFGTMLHYGDRVFRYAGIGGVAVTAGKTLQASAAVANHRDVAVQAAAAAAATAVTVTLGATAATENQYAEGYLHICDDAGQGQLLRIKSHPAISSAGNGVFTLYDPVVTALTTSSKADLIACGFNDLVVAPAAETGPVVGVTAMDMTADYFGWVQVAGPCSVLTDGTLVLGNHAVRSGGTAGAAAPATDDLLENLGSVMVVNGNTDNSVVWLKLGSS